MLILAIPRRKINLVKGEILTVIKTFLKGEAIRGGDIDLFEKKFADYIGVKYVFALSSGRAALRIILKVLDLPPGSEVMIPAFTDESVPWAIMREGLKPVFLDVRREDGNIDITEIVRKMNKNTKAIIATHIFGNICDIEEILKICDKHNIIVIEDCAHAPGCALRNKRRVGSFGKLSFFSFSSTKHFHTYGGGCILTNEDILAEKIKTYLNSHKIVSPVSLEKIILFTWIMAVATNRIGFTFMIYPILLVSSIFIKDDFMVAAYNKIFKKKKNQKLDIKRLSNLQAKIALMRLSSLENENKKKQENVATLRKYLRPNILGLEMKPSENSVYYFYILQVKDKNSLSKHLLWRGIDTGKYLMRNVAALYKDKESYPNTEWVYEHSLQIPIYSCLSRKNIEYIAEVINKEFF